MCSDQVGNTSTGFSLGQKRHLSRFQEVWYSPAHKASKPSCLLHLPYWQQLPPPFLPSAGVFYPSSSLATPSSCFPVPEQALYSKGVLCFIGELVLVGLLPGHSSLAVIVPPWAVTDCKYCVYYNFPQIFFSPPHYTFFLCVFSKILDIWPL